MTAPAPLVEITYCRLCGWLLRASWMAQELLTTFAEDIGAVTLIPNSEGGVFEIKIDGVVVWSRKSEGRFPEIAELKRTVRDRIAPGKHLGHADARKDRDTQ
jgi:selenoprotein W-related protein